MIDRHGDATGANDTRSPQRGEAMVIRCYFTRRGHFVGVEILSQGPRAEAIRQAEALFWQRAAAERFDGFEVWDGDHLIHRANR